MVTLNPERTGRPAVAIIVAGGTAERFGSSSGKQLAMVAGLPLLGHTLRAFDAASSVGLIVVVCPPDRVDEFERTAVEAAVLATGHAVVAGGLTRQESVRNGLSAIPGHRPESVIVVHDGARPLVTSELIDGAVATLLAEEDLCGLVVGHPAYDTIKTVVDRRIVATPDREGFWIAQTPQLFRRRPFEAAHAAAERRGFLGTDDAAVMEADGGLVWTYPGPRENLKVTVAEDLAIVEAVLSLKREREMTGSLRIGIGYDVHRFAAERPLVLGGVEIPHHVGLAGYSDADVLVHALIDALLGAVREGDIGHHFPDTDPAYAGISSMTLLERTAALVRDRGWLLVDADCVLVLEQPKIAAYRERMRRELADRLGVELDRVGVKATTTEGLGFTGREEGVAAQAVVLLQAAHAGAGGA